MDNSKRVAWLEAAYIKLRERLLEEAPPVAQITVGFPTKKRSGKNMVIGQCHFDAMKDAGPYFGAEIIIIIHPFILKDLIETLATLLHEMIHAALPPEVRHGKEFQRLAKRVGLVKPWTATQPDAELVKILREIIVELEEEIGPFPSGYYEPPPPKPKKPSSTKKYICECEEPRVLTLSPKKMEIPILCGACDAPFQEMPEQSKEDDRP